MLIRRLGSLTGLCVGLWTAAVFAGGPVPKDVAADAKAYIHVDTAALRGTEFYKSYQAAAAGVDMPLERGLRVFTRFAGFNPLTDLESVTLYTTTMGEHEGVTLCYGKMNRGEIDKHAASLNRHAAVTYNGHTIHTWWDARNERTIAGCVYSDHLVVAADSTERLQAALDVLDGKKPGGSELAKRFPTGALVHLAMDDMETFASRPRSQALANARSLDLSISEKAGSLTATLTIAARDDRNALQFKRVAEGLKALAALNADKSPETAKFVEDLTIQAAASTVTLSLSHASSDVITDLKALKAEREAAAIRAAAATQKSAGER